MLLWILSPGSQKVLELIIVPFQEVVDSTFKALKGSQFGKPICEAGIIIHSIAMQFVSLYFRYMVACVNQCPPQYPWLFNPLGSSTP